MGIPTDIGNYAAFTRETRVERRTRRRSDIRCCVQSAETERARADRVGIECDLARRLIRQTRQREVAADLFDASTLHEQLAAAHRPFEREKILRSLELSRNAKRPLQRISCDVG